MPAIARHEALVKRANGHALTFGFAEHEWTPVPSKLNHLTQRLASRWSITLTRDLYNAMVDLIRSQKVKPVEGVAKGEKRRAYDVMIGDIKVRLIYRARAGGGTFGYIITAIPPDGCYIAEPN